MMELVLIPPTLTIPFALAYYPLSVSWSRICYYFIPFCYPCVTSEARFARRGMTSDIGQLESLGQPHPQRSLFFWVGVWSAVVR